MKSWKIPRIFLWAFEGSPPSKTDSPVHIWALLISATPLQRFARKRIELIDSMKKRTARP